MNISAEEHVLVVPTAVLHDAGLFQGFTPDVAHYLPRLLDSSQMRFLPRSAAEDDPLFKQLIPYVVLRCGGLVFHYRRGKAGAEARLRALRSLGVGGHVCAEDGGPAGDPYQVGLRREIEEEVHLNGRYEERCMGLINDDRTPVGRVHLGIVHVLELTAPQARPRDPALADAGFAPLADLRQFRDEFETWSQLLLDADVLEGARGA